MKNFYLTTFLAFLFISGTAIGQTFHNVTVANLTFTPASLEINVGDTVLWTNSQGLHSVDGFQANFPNNPESFGNEIGPAGWTYQFVFTIPGTYAYRCAEHPASMFGSITVSDTTLSLNDIKDNTYFALYPNPVVDQLSWKWNESTAQQDSEMSIYNVTGKLVDRFSLNSISTRDLSNLSEGVYSFIILNNSEPIQSGKIVISR